MPAALWVPIVYDDIQLKETCPLQGTTLVRLSGLLVVRASV
jgi:hypothetical protein